eukprot:Skav210637  [mRNA]  locus=scaffold1063:158018:165272:- [translate_table: standard]
MLKCASRGKADLLDFEELEFYRTAGPVEWQAGDDGYQWKWRQPVNTFWDERRRVYVQEQKGSMCSVGKVAYFRGIVVVGGLSRRSHILFVRPTVARVSKEVSGWQALCKVLKLSVKALKASCKKFCVLEEVQFASNAWDLCQLSWTDAISESQKASHRGFGSTPKECRADGTLKALQLLGMILVGQKLGKGQEYKHTMTLVPRPIGRGLKANKKFLPLLYILGLDNCKVKFMFKKWFTRVRAIKRCLDQAKDTMRKLMRKHALHFKKRGPKIATETDVRPGTVAATAQQVTSVTSQSLSSVAYLRLAQEELGSLEQCVGALAPAPKTLGLPGNLGRRQLGANTC